MSNVKTSGRSWSTYCHWCGTTEYVVYQCRYCGHTYCPKCWHPSLGCPRCYSQAHPRVLVNSR